MRKHNTLEKAGRFFNLIYVKLVRIDDTPQKIAAGFGLGVFTGVMPFAGPIAALFLAVLFKVNRLGALLGSILTNTWISILAFLLSVRVGSFLFHLNGNVVRERWASLFKDFHIADFFTASAIEIVLPVVTGYLVTAIISAMAAYIAVSIVMKFRNKKAE